MERDGIPVKPGLYELLEYLEAQKIPAALASASRMEYTEKNLEKQESADILPPGYRRYGQPCQTESGDFLEGCRASGRKAGGLSGSGGQLKWSGSRASGRICHRYGSGSDPAGGGIEKAGIPGLQFPSGGKGNAGSRKSRIRI